jgi:hypothetical protein
MLLVLMGRCCCGHCQVNPFQSISLGVSCNVVACAHLVTHLLLLLPGDPSCFGAWLGWLVLPAAAWADADGSNGCSRCAFNVLLERLL